MLMVHSHSNYQKRIESSYLETLATLANAGINTPRDGVRSHCIAIDQLYITEENVYMTFAHCYYQKLLLAPYVGIFYHNVLMSLCYNGGCGKLRALYPLLLIGYRVCLRCRKFSEKLGAALTF